MRFGEKLLKSCSCFYPNVPALFLVLFLVSKWGFALYYNKYNKMFLMFLLFYIYVTGVFTVYVFRQEHQEHQEHFH